MTRITLIDTSDATGAVERTSADIKSAFGVVSNMFKAVANYINVALDLPVDFPGVKLARAA